VNNDYVLLNNKDNRNKPVATMKAVLSLTVPALSVVSLAGYLYVVWLLLGWMAVVGLSGCC
jgi:hypothetical protein